MDASLLTTKLHIPPQPLHVIHRDRLTDALEHAILHYKLILVAAPAGYGKTTLLAQWARTTRLSVVWLSLSEEDNDPKRLLRYLVTGWEAVQPGVSESKVGLLLSGLSPDIEAVLAAIINAANDLPSHTVFVLDDYHLVEDPAIHQALTFLLDHLPPTLHLVLVSRGEPSLPLARYRARAELLELGVTDLQFGLQESAAFFNQSMGLELAEDKIIKLQDQLEGWVAGLQLAALTLQQHLTGTDKLVVSGRHRFIADYLAEDVLAPLPDKLRRFLLQTGILDRLCGPLCDAITGKEDGQAMLETLEREKLFLGPLDDSREWFRYHPLFADFLREELNRHHPNEVSDFHRRAARWYLANDLPEPAFDHALEGSDAELMVQIFDRYMNAKLSSGEIRVVERWVKALPAEWYSLYPVLGLARVGFLVYTGAFEESMRYIDEVEQRLTPAESEDRRWQLARVMAVRCFMACAQNDIAGAEVYAGHALQALSAEDRNWRPGIYATLGDAYRHNARWEEARASYLEALAVTDSPELRFLSVHVFGALADLALRQGRLRDANSYWRKAVAVIQKRENWDHLELPVMGWVYIRLGELLYEGNELAAAWEHLSRGLESAELGGDVRAMIAGYVIAGRLKLTLGEIAAATEYLELARPLVENAPFPDWVARFDRLQIELWLAQGQLRTAINWADEVGQGDELRGRLESEEAHLAMSRVLIVKGDAPTLGQALALLKRLLESAEAEGRTAIIIEALALQALAEWQRGEQPEAMTALERALRTAEPEGYVRLFADLGLPLARLLLEARSRDVMPDYVGKLLAAVSADLALPGSAEGTLPEPLSLREQEVLQLISAGLTNREIAEQLVISPETVKKHTGSIYGKLGVRGRTEAVRRAREVDLLD
jgi:LuxR family maltose regulon positive regulatory protein